MNERQDNTINPMKADFEQVREEVKQLKEFLESGEHREQERKNKAEYLSKLKSAYSNFVKKESFKIGQIVQWKENLKNRELPHKNQPAIVLAVLDEPIIDRENNSSSPYFLEPLDIVLGIIVDEDTFLTFYYDSRRFEAYDESSPL